MMKQYAERDIENLDEIGNHYCIHVDAMTREKLHDKSDIAGELAFRDYKINQLRDVLEKLAKLGNGDYYGNSIGNTIAIEALKEDNKII